MRILQGGSASQILSEVPAGWGQSQNRVRDRTRFGVRGVQKPGLEVIVSIVY